MSEAPRRPSSPVLLLCSSFLAANLACAGPPPEASVALLALDGTISRSAATAGGDTAGRPRIAYVRRGGEGRYALLVPAGVRVAYDVVPPAGAGLEVYVALLRGDAAEVVLGRAGTPARRALERAAGWQPLRVDLAGAAGERTRLLFAVAGGSADALVAFGAPVVRGAGPATRVRSPARRALGDPLPPQRIVLRLRACEWRTPAGVSHAGVAFEHVLPAALDARASLAALLRGRWMLPEAAQPATETPAASAGEGAGTLPGAGGAATLPGVLRRGGYATAAADPAGWLGEAGAAFDVVFAAAGAARAWRPMQARPVLLLYVEPRGCEPQNASAGPAGPAAVGATPGDSASAGTISAAEDLTVVAALTPGPPATAAPALTGRRLEVPVEFRWPGVLPNRRVYTTVSLVDVGPTIVDLAGQEPDPHAGVGQSLLPLIAAPDHPAAFGFRRRPILIAAAGPGRLQGAGEVGLVLDGWMLVRGTDGADRLYDRARDPKAREEITPRHVDLLRRLAGELDRAVAAARTPATAVAR